MDFEADCKSAWHTVKDSDSGFTKPDGTALAVGATYLGTPARKPVIWDKGVKMTDNGTTTELAVRSWSFTITNNIDGLPNAAGDGTAVQRLGGFYPGDLDMELALTIPSEDSKWIRRRLEAVDEVDLLFEIDLDGAALRLGTARLAMDQSAMTSTSGYDEVLTFDIKRFRWNLPAVNGTYAAPDDGGRSIGGEDRTEPEDEEEPLPEDPSPYDLEPAEDPEQRRGRW